MLYKIMVVEDNSDCREVIALQLKRIGYEIIEAPDGESGIEKALAESPHLIIMDLGLPGMSGFEAAVRLKADPRTSHIPIIAYTGYPEEICKDRAENAGIEEFLMKPVPPKLVKTTIERYLL